MQTLEKVACFALRARPTGPELLVICHPTAGLQVPAGSIEVGETPEVAAMREFFEETGTHANVVQKLGMIEKPYSEMTGSLTAHPDDRSAQISSGTLRGGFLRRGLPVTIQKHADSQSYVTYEEKDYNASPPQVLGQISGWVPTMFIATTLRRHLFYVQSPPVTSEHDRWAQDADGQQWVLEWKALEPGLCLIGEQQDWLNTVSNQLRERHRTTGPYGTTFGGASE